MEAASVEVYHMGLAYYIMIKDVLHAILLILNLLHLHIVSICC